ncbi:oxygen-independent coproporphyrinogen-III oxidase-like protein YqeR [Clostridium acetireducens DSM 10703]|jgi:oxygen-independent coproporphyrinogen-3 oxidase|uniref:Heme chaperone HemW n=1 Tax=Clostridium acetireducens DSM 10703 TaxID=1121290 RepID=A0A1E8F179_9CLOT|nr:radical SAM family heme chaperone HemW [Clostridium acetireducens]OFI07195.1 oxygen-independent coproporphyrinogen-III oxidase-like protein YqeR [Clostridium acetireducens DSM 10703]
MLNSEVALYIHIPFCKSKCFYCDFPSFCGKESLMIDYAKALSKEIDRIEDVKIKTIFIGGGTPTYLPLEAWNIIKNSIDKLDKSNNIEFTVEGNPGTFSREKLKFLNSMGVNRLSIGLQAWQNNLLKNLGRIHNLEEFLQTFQKAREEGFSNINIDLMFGLSHQTFENWQETLKNIIQLNPEHISCYSLIIEEGTKLYNMYNSNKLKLPSEDLEREMYRYCLEILELNNYTQYEISNFAKKNKQCKHNLAYWNLYDYIGCGAAAHSYFNNKRYRNTNSIENYIDSIYKGKSPIEEIHNNSLKDNVEEFMFMGLRKTKGISMEDFKKRFNVNIYHVYGEIINKYLNNNLLIQKEDRLFLSKRGIEISNSIMCDFII